MPDFFARLLARSMPTDPAAQAAAGVVPARPRVPGRFERAAPLPEMDEPAAPAEREAVVREAERVVTERAPTMPRPMAVPAITLPAPERVVERHRERVTEVHREAVAAQREAVTGEVTTSRAVPLAAREVVRPAPARPAQPVTSRTVVEARPLLVPPKVEAAPAPAVPTRRDTAAPAPPTVHVRIGRIEVAAPPPTQPAPRRRGQRAAPAPSPERHLDGSGP